MPSQFSVLIHQHVLFYFMRVLKINSLKEGCTGRVCTRTHAHAHTHTRAHTQTPTSTTKVTRHKSAVGQRIPSLKCLYMYIELLNVLTSLPNWALP